jgi:biotin carboxyl carrier protein
MGDALAEPVNPARTQLCAVAATLAQYFERRATDDYLPSVPTGFRNNRFADQLAEFEGDVRVEYRALGQGKFVVSGATWSAESTRDGALQVLTLTSPDGLRQRARVVAADGKLFVHTRLGDEVLIEKPRFPAATDSAVKGGFIAPMPGKVVKVHVKAGDAVKKAQALLVLEAMKMEQVTRSPADGVVKQVLVREGDQVTAGQILVTMEE